MIASIRDLAKQKRIQITHHAKAEMEADEVRIEALARALAASDSEVVEDYPEDRRGHSHLVLAWLSSNEPAHVCCAIHENQVVIITVYRPDGVFWMNDWRTRR